MRVPTTTENRLLKASKYEIDYPGKVLHESERHFVAILGGTSGGDIVFACESVWPSGPETWPPRGCTGRYV